MCFVRQEIADDRADRPAAAGPESLAWAAERITAAGGILMTMQSLSQRGGERVGILLANGFARAGIPTRIALMRNAGEGEHELRGLLHPDVSVVSAGPPMGIAVPLRGSRLGRKQLERVRAVPFIRREMQQFRPAIVLGTVNSLALVTALARGRQKGGPSFALKLTNRLWPPNMAAPRRHYRHRRFRFIFSRFDVALTLSEAERRSALDLYPGRENVFRTVPNPYVTDEILSGPSPLRSGPPRLLTVARMVPQKRLDILLRAFALSGHETARLTILGDGPLRPDLQRLANKLGVADRVAMPGFSEDVVSWLRRSDLFVLSSDYEGLPAVVLEALACGVPVVTTDSFGSARELLHGLDGCAVEPIGNPQRLANAIESSLDAIPNPDRLRGVAREYLIDHSVDAHIVALGRVVASPSSGAQQPQLPLRPAAAL